MVYAMSGFNGAFLKAISLIDARGDITGTGAIAWSHNRDTPYVSSPLLYDGALYFTKYVHGILSVFDATAGKAHYGPQRVTGLRNIMASPVAADGRVYLTGRDGTTVVIKHGKTYEVLATNKLDDQFSASMALVDDQIYMRGDSYLYCIAEG
jgi:outer membrane protein assembly factor BamB